MTDNGAILVVEDNPDILAATVRLLRSAGYTILEAMTGAEGLRIARERRPDIVLLDVMLPDIDRRDLVREMKSDPHLPLIFVVLTSNFKVDSDDQSEGLELGADGYITRPISNRELLARVGAFVRMKHAEDALRTSEERYRNLVNAAKDVVFAIMADGTLTSLNPAFEHVTGRLVEDWLGKSFASLIHPEDLPRTLTFLQAILAGQAVDTFDIRVSRASGGCLYAEMTVTPQWLDGHVVGALGIARDITERKHAEEELRRSQALLNATGRIARVGGWEVNIRDQSLTWTDEVYRIHEVAEGFQPTVTTAIDFYAPESKPVIAEAVRRAIEQGEAFDLELQIITSKGERRWVHAVGEATRLDGQIVSVAGTFQDVTERARAEDEKAHLEVQLRQAQKMESVGRLAGGVAHDFNNMLASIVGNLELAQISLESAAIGKAQEFLVAAKNASMRARNVTQQLLTFAIGSGPHLELIQLEPLIRDAAFLSLAGSPCRCQVDCAPDLWRVKADPGQWTQVMHHLLVNAQQAMAGGGLIHVSAENLHVSDGAHLPLPKGPYVRICVRDDGAGIPAELLDRIFDPFYTTKQGASGLGLTVTHSIVRSHDGAVTVKSAPGQGSEFSIYLPAQPDHAPEQASPGTALPEIRPWRILVLDDEPSITRMLKIYLERSGHTVMTAADGAAAIEAWSRAIVDGAPFDVGILDLTIPGGMGGKEAAACLRTMTPQARLIASSGYSTDPIMAQYRDYGFSARLPKPYRLEEVTGLIRELQLNASMADA